MRVLKEGLRRRKREGKAPRLFLYTLKISFDTLSTAAILRGRVQQEVQIDQLSLGPEIYGHRTRR